ncbi:MAG: outer membrane protein assembly factor BamE [Chthoniobacterales bacterium]
MTKHEPNPNDEFRNRPDKRSASFRHWSFVIPSSFVIRASSFARIRHLSFVISRLLLVLMLALMLDACPGRRITKANVDEVAEGMSKKQVESILGSPSEIDNKDFVIMKKTTYVYRQGKDSVTIIFKDDKVAEKQSTLSD